MNNLSELYKKKGELLSNLEILKKDIDISVSFKEKPKKENGLYYGLWKTWESIKVSDDMLDKVKDFIKQEVDKQLIKITEQIKQIENGNN